MLFPPDAQPQLLLCIPLVLFLVLKSLSLFSSSSCWVCVFAVGGGGGGGVSNALYTAPLPEAHSCFFCFVFALREASSMSGKDS